MKKRLISILALVLLNFAHAEIIHINTIFQVEISSTINPATFEHLKKSISKTSKIPGSLLLIKMTTPGGLVSTTKEILNLFGESEVPISVWISPEGSSATSAGAIIASGAHYLFMSEGTNIGAATPITMNGDLGEKPKPPGAQKVAEQSGSDVRAKAVNDLVALVQALCEARGRNTQAYGLMIEEAKSYSAQEAKSQNIIDALANNLTDIANYISTKQIRIKGKTQTYIVDANTQLEKIDYSLSDQLLNTFASPEVAYVLLLLGIALLYFEMQAPGGFISGGFGVLFLLLAAIGFHVLPVNFGGIGLIFLSFILIGLELYITSFGLLALAGIVSLVFGSLILFDTADSLITLNLTVLISTIISILTAIAAVSYFFFKTRLKNNKKDFFLPISHLGIIEKILEPQGTDYWYQTKIDGVIWKAKSKQKLNIGQSIKVTSNIEGSLNLNIDP